MRDKVEDASDACGAEVAGDVEAERRSVDEPRVSPSSTPRPFGMTSTPWASPYNSPNLTPQASSPVAPRLDRELSLSASRCSPAPSSCSHASGSSHPPNSRSRKRRRISYAASSFDESQSRVNGWDDGQWRPPPAAMRRTSSENTVAERFLTSPEAPRHPFTSRIQERQLQQKLDRLQKKLARREGEIRRQNEQIHQIHRQQEANRHQNQMVQVQIEVLSRQSEKIQDQDATLRSQGAVILALTRERDYYVSELDRYRDHHRECMPEKDLSSRPPHLPRTYLPSSSLWSAEPMERHIPITQTASPGYPTFSPLGLLSPHSDTRGNKSTARLGSQAGQMMSVAQLAGID